MNYAMMIKEYREKTLISQQDLADLLGVAFVSVSRWENGHYEPTYKAKRKLRELFIAAGMKSENYTDDLGAMDVKECKINNRRYLGNKYKLLSFIKETVDNYCENVNSIADIFSGTGSVSSAFWDLRITTNDILYSNYISNVAWFSPEKVDKTKLKRIIAGYNNYSKIEKNYMTDNFSDTYFSKEDCSKIGYVREDIEKNYRKKIINERERAVLITSLLYAMDHIAKTCGHYDAYIRNATYTEHLELCYPDVPNDNNQNNMCFNMDSNLLVRNITADLVYIDPPYNSRQYCDAYHLLENVARWSKPEVEGVAKKMDRKHLKSKYCTKSATEAFEDLIENINARYILLSYNNMAKKGNDRSNAKISDEDIIRILNVKGRVMTFSKDYKAFTTGQSDIEGNEERLFLCICRGDEEND